MKYWFYLRRSTSETLQISYQMDNTVVNFTEVSPPFSKSENSVPSFITDILDLQERASNFGYGFHHGTFVLSLHDHIGTLKHTEGR